MPRLGDTISNFDTRNEFIKLKAVGEKLTLRLISGIEDDYVMDALHIMRDGDAWIVESCPRTMINKTCVYCEKYFEIIKEKNGVKDENIKKEIEDRASFYRATVKFYYPVLNLDTGNAGIFETSQAIRSVFKKDLAEGINPYLYDYVVKREAKNGAGAWSVTRKDSAQTKELSEAELKEFEKASRWNLGDLTGVNKKLKDLNALYKDMPEPTNPTPKHKKAKDDGQSTDLSDVTASDLPF